MTTTEFDVAAYLASKGLRGRSASGGREMTYPCFFDCGEPADSSKRKLYLSVSDGFFHCKVCGASGGTYMLQKHFGDEPRTGTSDDSFMRRRILDSAVDVAVTMLSNNDDVMLYLLNDRGLTADTIIERKLGFIAGGWSLVGSLPEGVTTAQVRDTGLVHRDGPSAGKDFFFRHLIIPIITRGHCIQIRGRAWGEVRGGKYFTGPGGVPRIYNADSLDGAEEVIVTEGEFDCMVLAQHLAGSPEGRARKIAVIGLPGTNAVPEDFDALISGVKRVFIGFDNDLPGMKAAETLKERIGARARIIKLPNEDDRKCDWTEYLLPDNGKRAFKIDHPYAGHGWRDVLRLMSTAAGKRVYSVAEAGEAFRAYRQQHDGLLTGYTGLDASIAPGILPGQVVIVLAKTGCIAGDAEIAVNRAGKGFKIPIAKLLDRWEGKKYAWDRSIPTFVQREEDGVVRLARLKNAWRSGEKMTYEVITTSGRSIRATDEHPFLTPDGWRQLLELNAGDFVNVHAGRSSKGRQPKPSYARRTVPAHPYRGRRNVRDGGNSVALHRLVVDANLNGWTLDCFISHLRDPQADVSGLTFLDPQQFAVHHIDHDPRNNDLSNLLAMTHERHHQVHAMEGKYKAVLEQIGVEQIIEIRPHGLEETYDLEVEDDPHNFLANGFVVHNTGKTIWLCNLAYQMRKHRVLFVSLEMTREEVYDRLRRIYLFHHPTATDDEVDFGLSSVFICDENRLGTRDLSALASEFAIEADGQPEIVLVDYLGYYARGFPGGSPYEKVGNAVMELKAEAKQGRFAIVSPAQVNRGAKEGKPIDLDDARDAGTIEETADFLLALYRPDDALMADGVVVNQQPTGKVKLSILKSRHGGKGRVFSLQMDMLTLAIVDDPTPASQRAADHNYLHWRGHDWDHLRRLETAPIQTTIKGIPHAPQRSKS